MFKSRKDAPKPVVDVTLEQWTRLQRDLAVLTANVDAMEMKWVSFKDEVKKLVNRLEKREQRAAERNAVEEPDTPQVTNPMAERLLRRGA